MDTPSVFPARVLVTPAAEVLMAQLVAQHGPLMFHQSGGCCDGSAPMCFARGEFHVGGQDVLLGHIIEDTPVWIGARQFEYWRHTQITIDVVPGRGAGMSLEGPEGMRFIVRSRVFSDAEVALLALAGEPLHGDRLDADGRLGDASSLGYIIPTAEELDSSVVG